MNRSKFKILDNIALTSDVYRMRLEGDTSAITMPGQFVEIELPGRFLRRPISVCDVAPGVLTLVYKTVGVGTAEMAAMGTDQELDLLCGLGHGFTVDTARKRPVLIGGGVGVPPLYKLAKCWIEAGVKPVVALGFNKSSEIMLASDFRQLGIEVAIATVDGSEGTKGFVTHAVAAIDEAPDYFQACGPLPMLKAIASAFPEMDGEYSLEERMGCGFGACMGCTIHTAEGPARVCTEGPVFSKALIDWNQI